MSLRTLTRLSLAAALALPLGFAADRAEAQVNVDVNVTLNGIVILNYYSVINVTIPSTVFTGLFGCTGNLTAGPLSACSQGNAGAMTVTGGVTGLTATPAAVVPTPGPGSFSLTALPLTLEDVWAVRAIANAGGGNVNVSVSATGGPLVRTGGTEQITIGTPTVTPASFPALGLVNPQYGDVTLPLNLTAATRAGVYTSASGNDYTLDVVLL